MGFSYLTGITRVANILTVLIIVAEFMKCEISDIMTMIVNTVRLAALVLDVFVDWYNDNHIDRNENRNRTVSTIPNNSSAISSQLSRNRSWHVRDTIYSIAIHWNVDEIAHNEHRN